MRLPFRDVMDQLLFEMVLPNTLCSFERIGRDLVVHLWLKWKAGYNIDIIVNYVLNIYIAKRTTVSSFQELTEVA